MAYGQVQETAANNLADAKRETIQSLISSFERHTERLAKLSHQLDQLADRLEGSRPTGVQEASPATPPHCLTDDIRRKQQALNKLINECEEATMRIVNALGV